VNYTPCLPQGRIASIGRKKSPLDGKKDNTIQPSCTAALKGVKRMDPIIGFKELQVGQVVKAKGKFGENGTFTALEISVKRPKDYCTVDCPIQEIDYEARKIKVHNAVHDLPEGFEILNADGETIALQDLQPGTMVKLKGHYSDLDGFKPFSLKIKETMGFNIDKLQGAIEDIDPEAQTLRLVGFTVETNGKTVVEGI